MDGRPITVAVSDLELEGLCAIALVTARDLPVHVFYYPNQRDAANPALIQEKLLMFSKLFGRFNKVRLFSGDLVVPDTPYGLLVIAPFEPKPHVLGAMQKHPPVEIVCSEHPASAEFVSWAANVPLVSVTRVANPDAAFSFGRHKLDSTIDILAGGLVAGMLKYEGVEGTLTSKDGKACVEPGPGQALQLRAHSDYVAALAGYLEAFFEQAE